MISSMSSAACTALRKGRLSVGGADVLGSMMWIHQFSSGDSVTFLLVRSCFCEVVGTSSTAENSPVSRPATRAPDSVTMRNVTVSTQATL